jgi:TRAP-type C4-dicarboxylate transport system permease small subunit
MRAAAKALTRLNDAVARLVRVTVTVLAIVMLASVSWAVFTRVAFRHSPPWSEEIALLMFSWIILLMTASAVRDLSHARLDSLLHLLSPSRREVADRVIAFVMAATGAYLLWSGLDYLEEMKGSRSAAMRYPMELLYLALPIASALIVLYGIERALIGPPREGRSQ